MRSESEFISAIDCCFPYDDLAAADSLIREACCLSPNAAYMVVHELARRPRGSRVSDSVCLAHLEMLDRIFKHPVKALVLRLARRMVCSDPVEADECVEAMREIGRYPGMYNALSVAYFAAYFAGVDEGEIDRVYEEILAAWEAA